MLPASARSYPPCAYSTVLAQWFAHNHVLALGVACGLNGSQETGHTAEQYNLYLTAWVTDASVDRSDRMLYRMHYFPQTLFPFEGAY